MSGNSLSQAGFALGVPLLFGLTLFSSPDFSHPVHLDLGLACTRCHAGAETGRLAADQMFPQPAVCLSCHSDGKTTPLDPDRLRWTAPERTYRFDHAFHVRLGDLAPLLAAAIDGGKYFGSPQIRPLLDRAGGCTACHRGLETSEATPLPVMSDCLVCHSEIDNPFSCSYCHLEGVNLRPADHTPEFADLHSTGKIKLDKASCLPCHGTNFECRGCH
jgi:hypothetical protein